MSSAGTGPEAALVANIQQNDYVTLAILTAYAYDYVLTISNEIEYIWSKPWSRVSTSFVLVRYFGLLSFIVPTLLGSTFLPGPAKVTSHSHFFISCRILFIVHAWAYPIFLGASDLVMILRVWAVYNQSRSIGGTLVTLYVIAIVPGFAVSIIYSDPNNLSVSMIQILKLSLCTVEGASKIPIFNRAVTALQVILAAAMCSLILAQFFIQSFQMYKATGQWKLNPYMNLLVKQGVIYFLFILLFNVIVFLASSGTLFTGIGLATLAILQYIPVCMLTPRFILSVRELYARDLEGRRNVGIDTGFGLSLSASMVDMGGTTSVTMGPGRGEGEMGDGEDILMEERTIGMDFGATVVR